MTRSALCILYCTVYEHKINESLPVSEMQTMIYMSLMRCSSLRHQVFYYQYLVPSGQPLRRSNAIWRLSEYGLKHLHQTRTLYLN